MVVRGKTLVQKTLFLSASHFVVRSIGFLLRLWLSRDLGAQAMGLVELAQSAQMLLITPVVTGLPAAVSRLCAKAEGRERARVVRCALLLARRYAAGRAEMKTEHDRLALGLLALGALALGLSTDFFPWRVLCSLRKPFSTFFMQIQFPWRFVGMAVPMLSAAAAWGYLREERDAKTGMAALIALCVVFSGYTMQTMVQRAPELEKETYTDTRIGQFEYTYPCTEKTALKVGDVRTSQPGVCNVLSYEKRGTELTATVQLEGEAAYIELPLLYYPGYRAEIDGQAQTVARGTNNMVRVYGLSSGESGTVHVWYQPPTAWLIAQGASALGALLLAASLRRMRRRA